MLKLQGSISTFIWFFRFRRFSLCSSFHYFLSMLSLAFHPSNFISFSNSFHFTLSLVLFEFKTGAKCKTCLNSCKLLLRDQRKCATMWKYTLENVWRRLSTLAMEEKKRVLCIQFECLQEGKSNFTLYKQCIWKWSQFFESIEACTPSSNLFLADFFLEKIIFENNTKNTAHFLQNVITSLTTRNYTKFTNLKRTREAYCELCSFLNKK